MKALACTISALIIMALTLDGHAEEVSLENITASFIEAHFPLSRIFMVNEDQTTIPSMAGCDQTKRFSILRRHEKLKGPLNELEVAVALCYDGSYGPNNYQATIDASLKPLSLPDNASEKVKEELRIIMGTTFPLKDNRFGRTFWMPLIGHGVVFIPTAIAPTRDGKTILLIQSDLDMEENVGLLETMASLLLAIDEQL